jgi:hypothetical protein
MCECARLRRGPQTQGIKAEDLLKKTVVYPAYLAKWLCLQCTMLASGTGTFRTTRALAHFLTFPDDGTDGRARSNS